MGPRKRPLLDTRPEVATTKPARFAVSKKDGASSVDGYNVENKSTNSPVSSTAASSASPPNSKAGWYGGTWPRKSVASTQVARETILADKSKNTTTATELARSELKGLAIEQQLPEVAQGSLTSSLTEAGPVPVKQKEMTNLSAISSEIPYAPNTINSKDPQLSNNSSKVVGLPDVDISAASSTHDATSEDLHQAMPASTWRNWLGLSSYSQPSTRSSQDGDIESSQNNLKVSAEPVARILETTDKCQKAEDEMASSRSWFGLWSVPATSTKIENEPVRDDSIPVPDSSNSPAEGSSHAEHPGPSSGSTWAFWSKDSGRSAGKAGTRGGQGELAVAGESTEGRPAAAHTENVRMSEDANGDTVKQIKKAAPPEVTSTPRSNIQNTDRLENSPNTTVPKLLAPNLLLPPFRSTYNLRETPSFIQQLADFILHSRRTPQKHIYITVPHRIKKALAIGIHGLFPAPLLRTVIGHPTGTSIRFANHAAAAIHRWADKQGYSCDSVEKIALEGEGKIAERVDNLWKLLLNWMDHVRSADFIMVACHSQGVPVAIMLVAKLIELGVVSTARIGICAMAGVSLGPFADYKSRLFSGSAAELFDFAYSQSEVAKRYQESLRTALNYGVRVTYIGSIDDQLVSLESAIFSPVNHPYIYRAVFVDGRVHAPDFITHLVGFALKLRNLGVSDHGLIRELSVPLAGSLYSGGGHSSLYDETRVYDLAIEFALETSSVDEVSLDIDKYEMPTSSNPFQLPWSMRGLLEEDLVKTELALEAKELLKQFDQWKPTTKVLKDVKYRLEAVKSKL